MSESQPTKFVNLHVHSYYSLLDGMSKPDDIVDKVKSMKQQGFAITEHGNVSSSVKLYKLAKQNDLKFLYGCEFYVCNDRFIKNKNNKYYHLTVLAKNEQGRININQLCTLGYLEGFYSKPRIDHELLEKYKDGLVILSGCMASELQQTLAGGKIGDNDIEITYGQKEKAKEIVRWYRNIFKDDYYLEVQSHTDKRQQQLNRAIIDIAKELNIEYVSTADSHFVNEEDFELHNIFIQIGTNREAGETYQDTQLQDEKEVREKLKPALTDEEIEIAIRNTSIIMDKCNVKMPISEPLIPHVKVPEGFKDEEQYLKHLCREGWKRRGIPQKSKTEVQKYKKRLNYEFNAIKKMGFIGYYLLVHSYVNVVKRRGIARGSGGGSLINYLINIVDIDPIKYDLYFERFIDVGALDLLESGQITRKELKIPDVDSDFGTNDREKVVNFIINKYGEERVASIGQFGQMLDKAAIKDIGRVLGVKPTETNRMTKALQDEDIEDALRKGYLDEWKDKYSKLFDYAQRISGTPKSFGLHPCGKVVGIEKLTQYTALATSKDKVVFQLDMDDVEEVGLVKIDALGLRTVDVIYDTLEMINKDYDYIAPDTLDFDDQKVYEETFQNGHTDGLFQFESPGMKSTLKDLKPTNLHDLAVANALYRPGAMKYIPNYINRKHGKEEESYIHNDLQPILKDTYGVIVYQEQLIEIGRLSGLRNPDLLRKATGKKIRSLMDKIEPEMKNGLMNQGWTEEQVNKLWNDILDFAKYSFNKSHAYAYSIIAYICAYLKTYHPLEFMCALLNSIGVDNIQDKWEKLNLYYNEAKRLNIAFNEFDYTNPSPLCEIQDDKINYGTKLIKGCNLELAAELKNLNNQHELFTDLLINIAENTTINKTQLIATIKLGFFKEYGTTDKLLYLYEQFSNGKGVKYQSSYADKTKIKRKELLNQLENEYQDNKSNYDQLLYEKELLGFAKTTYPNQPKMNGIITGIDETNSPKLYIYQLSTGKETMIKVQRKKFYDYNGKSTLHVGDVVEIRKTKKKQKQRMIGHDEKGKPQFEPIENQFEPWLESCKIIN